MLELAVTKRTDTRLLERMSKHYSKPKGFVGRMSGFKIMQTNNYPTDTGKKFLVAFDKESIHFVAQMTKIKITDGEKGFYKNFLGEMVYGGKVFAENGKRIVTNEISA